MDSSFTARSRSLLIVLASLTLVAGVALPEIWAQAVDPQSLVGKWEGTWTNISHPSSSGDYNMTVTKADGNQVYGRTERFLTTGERRTADFVGTLEGDQLKFSNSFSSTELAIGGSQIQGYTVDNFRLAIKMTKAK